MAVCSAREPAGAAETLRRGSSGALEIEKQKENGEHQSTWSISNSVKFCLSHLDTFLQHFKVYEQIPVMKRARARLLRAKISFHFKFCSGALRHSLPAKYSSRLSASNERERERETAELSSFCCS